MMKKLNTIALISCGALGLLLTNACTQKYETYNTNPALVTAELADINLMLTNVEGDGIINSASYGNGSYGCYCGMDKRDDDDPFNQADAPGEWNFEYTDQINNLSNIIQLIAGKANSADLVNKTAIARILKVWAVSKLTDTYGDVPYSESSLPQDQAVFSPKYDTQQSIYADLFKELKEAVAQLDPSKDSFGDADLVYGGDVVKWKKLGNSLRLRLALRIRYADPELAASAISDLSEADLITSYVDDAKVLNSNLPEESYAYVNPRFYRIVNYSTVGESVSSHQFMINILKNDSVHMDPRIKLYADTVMAAWKGGNSPNGYFFPAFKYRGSPTLGNTDVEHKYPWGSATVSDLSDFWRVPILAPAIIRSSEVYFSLAEAKLVGMLPASFSGTANSYYQKGIDESINWYQLYFYPLCAPQIPDLMKTYIHNANFSPDTPWTDADVQQYLDWHKITDAEVTAFKSTPVYTLSGSAEQQLEMIINQKIVGLYPDEFQGWCEYRRTGYPKVQMPVGIDNSDLHGVAKRREIYPTFEQSINSANLADAVSRLSGGDNDLSRFWWDANSKAPYQTTFNYPTLPKAWQ